MRKLLFVIATGICLAAVALPAASAAASAPTAVTGSASGVTEKTAALSGTVTPNGAPTRYWFEYGTTTGYGSQTGMRRAGNGSASENVAANLFGLTPGTTYHFRLDASNNQGTTQGADQTFVTGSVTQPAVVTGSASNVNAKNAVLSGTVNPDGSQTRYWFEYGTTASYGSQTPMRRAGDGSSTLNVTGYLAGLTPGTTYYFRLDAMNAGGTVDGSQATFTTTAQSAPTVVTGSASGVTEKSAALGGTLTPNGSPTRYWFEYGTSTSYGSQTAHRFGGSGSGSETVGAILFGLTPGTTYHYRLDASSGSGSTIEGADATFTTQPATVLPHHQWFAGQVSSVGSNSLTVGVLWTGPHDGELNGQTITVSVATGTRISQGPHNMPIALGQIQTNDLVGIDAVGDSPTSLTATRIHVNCNCHWVGGTISSLSTTGTSFQVQVARTGPFDTVLKGQDVTIQVNSDTVYLQGPHKRRIAFSDLKDGEGVGVVFGANGFFRAPGFNPATATFTAIRVHVWGQRQVPSPASDADLAAGTSVPG